MWPSELPDTIDLACDRPIAADEGRPEPVLASVPYFIEYDEPMRLDPERVGLLWELPPKAPNPIRARGPISSLLIHLLPLLTVIGWPHPTLELPQPIPVQLVIEEPPPLPEPAPQPPQQSPPTRRASDDFGQVKPPQPGTASSDAPAAAGEKQASSAEPQTPSPNLVQPPPIPPPKPAPPKDQSAFKLPKPPGAPVAHHDTPHEAPRAARYPGPDATHDEYLAYLAALTRQHTDLVPRALVAGRRGLTVLSIQIQTNGTIGRISIDQSSGYRDLDERVEMMVRAVGRFPPLPQWYQGNVMEVTLRVGFPMIAE